MANKSPVEVKPMYSFTETDNEARFDLVIDGLKVSRKIVRAFKLYPDNALILNEIIDEQSINFAIEFRPSATDSSKVKIYRFHVKRLPSEIVPEKTRIKFKDDKITITLHKKETDSWRQFTDSDFETIHLVSK